jgi:hypothetical protein
MKKIFIILTAVVIFVPLFAFAQSPSFVIPCDGVTVPCTFGKFMELIQNVLDFLILLSIPFATIAFAWAGWLMLTSGGSGGKIDHAKEIFWKVLWGFVFVLSAWLIVRFITNALLDENNYEDLLEQGSSVMREYVPAVGELVFVDRKTV